MQFGPVNVTAWHALSMVPIVLVAVAIIGGAVPLLDQTRRMLDPRQLTKVAAAVGIVLIGYRLAVPPWQDSDVHPAWGGYLALIAAFGMLAAATGVASRGRLQTR